MKVKNKYSKKDRASVIALIESNHSGVEIEMITGFKIGYIGSISTSYWKEKMNIKKLPMKDQYNFLIHANEAKAKRIAELESAMNVIVGFRDKTIDLLSFKERKAIEDAKKVLLNG